MKLAVVALAVFLGACAATPVAPLPDDAPAILVTVALSDRIALGGSPARIFGYSGGYARSPVVERLLNELSQEYNLERVDAWPIASLGVHCQVFVVRDGRIDEVLTRLAADSRVESAQAMNQFETLAGTNDDPYRKLQTSLGSMSVAAAHRISTGNNVTVAVIDTHVDAGHPDLAGRVTKQKNVLAGRPGQPDVHGTGVAGVIAARADNGEGIMGIAPDARILALTACWRASDQTGRCNSFTLARALDAALAYGVDIINLSLSGPQDALLTRLIERALADGIVVVGARDPQDRDSFPCSVPGVLNVAATPRSDPGLGAPGSEVLTTVPGGSYDFLSGNSLAAAHVTGVVALALAADPSLTNGKLVRLLESSSDPATGVNACAALRGINAAWNCLDRVSTSQPSN